MGGYMPKGYKGPKAPVWMLGADAKVRIYPAVSSRAELSQYNADGMHQYAVAQDLGSNKKRGDYSVYWWYYRNGEWSQTPIELSMAFIYLRHGPLKFSEIEYPEHGDYCYYLTNKGINKTGDKKDD